MDCRDIEQTIAEGGSVGADADLHLRSCEPCRVLVDDRGQLARALGSSRPDEPVADLDLLGRELEAGLGAERGILGRVRAWPRAARLALVVALLLVDVTFFGTFMMRRDFDRYPLWRLVLADGVYAGIILLATWYALRPLYLRPAPAWIARAIFAGAILVPVAFALAPEVPTVPARDISYVAYAWYCFMTGCGQGLALLLLAPLLDRGGRVAGTEPLLLIAAAGVLGQIGLSVECPVNYPLHLLTGHAIVPAGMLLAALWWRRAGRMSERIA